jgi:hypothetical protein
MPSLLSFTSRVTLLLSYALPYLGVDIITGGLGFTEDAISLFESRIGVPPPFSATKSFNSSAISADANDFSALSS